MSLINQALRKAQRDRTPARMPEPGSSSPSAQAATGANGMKPGLLVGLFVALALLVGLVAGLSIVLIQGDGGAPAAQQASSATPETTIPEVATPSPGAPRAATSEKMVPLVSADASSKEAPPFEAEASSLVVEELRQAREAAEAKAAAEEAAARAAREAAAAKAAAEAKAAEEAAARAAAKPSQDIIDWLTKARVSGVMLSGQNSKLILNGKSYGAGDYANYALGLKVLVIEEKRILFVDENGKKYMKRL
jgi:hypothetical protein